MTFVMTYDNRNRNNLNKLADHTRLAAFKWYQYCIDNQIDILIYETIRTKSKQAENVRKGVSQTMKSYHIVGQALDFAPVINVKVTWSINAYTRGKVLDAINYAKKLGFTWGGDWDNDGQWRDETFLDSPHLQFNFTGYGKDTFGKIKENGEELTMSQYTDLLAKINKQDEKIAQLEKQVESKASLKSTEKVAESHKEAFEWAIKEGIIKGDDKSFNPCGALTRQQMATMLIRYHDKFLNK